MPQPGSVSPPHNAPKTPQEILAVHDRLLPELIQENKLQTQQI